jgi:hypothetical protein
MHLSKSLIPARFAALVLLALCAAALSAAPGAAQARTSPPPPNPIPAAPGATPGSEITIFHLYLGPGDDVYEKFAHNALWVHDPVRGTDRVFNYGAFDFDEPGYWGRFIRGDWLYSLRVDDLNQTIYVYQFILNRSIIAQELNLTAAQRAELRDFLEWNALEENRYYYYDYFRDNCSTRIRDAIDRVLGGSLLATTGDRPTGTTFRWHSDRLVADDPSVRTGLLVGLGARADREISAWEEMFLPEKVRDQLRAHRVPDGAGGFAALVRDERVIFQAVGRQPVREAPPNWLGWYLLAGVLVGALLALLGWAAPRARAARFGFAAFTALWLSLLGTGGLLLLFLWVFTNHTVAHANENLLQFNPLLLALIPLAPALAFGARWAVRPAMVLTAAVVAMSVLGLLLKALPAFGQANLSMIALALPAHLGLGWAVYRLARPADLPAERRGGDRAARHTGARRPGRAARGRKPSSRA